MKNISKILSTALIIISLFLLLSNIGFAADSINLYTHFENNFELGYAIANKLGKVELAQEEIDNITYLWLDRGLIDSLEGIELFENLEWFMLIGTKVSDLTPLSNLKKLTYLNLENNNITDISQLSNLTELESININNNFITDISPLVGLSKLQSLNMEYNYVNPKDAALDLIKETVNNNSGFYNINIQYRFRIFDSNLTVGAEEKVIKDIHQGNSPDSYLSVWGTVNGEKFSAHGIADLSKIRWEIEDSSICELDLDNNTIIGLQEGVTTITGYYMSGNGEYLIDSATIRITDPTKQDLIIKEVFPDSNFALEIAKILNKTVEDKITEEDIINTIRLDFDELDINDFSGIEIFSNVDVITMVNTKNIIDLTPIGELTGLEELSIHNFYEKLELSDITPLSKLNRLISLSLENTNISNLEALSGLEHLEVIKITNSNISDITPLKNKYNLSDLNLSGNNITDISPLANNYGLTFLKLDNNNISDISYIENLDNITELSLANNNISDIPVFSNLTDLNILSLSGNNISDISNLNTIVLSPYTHSRVSLYLNRNKIIDVTPLASGKFSYIEIVNNLITDITPLLANLANISFLDVSLNFIPLSDKKEIINNHFMLPDEFENEFIWRHYILNNPTNRIDFGYQKKLFSNDKYMEVGSKLQLNPLDLILSSDKAGNKTTYYYDINNFKQHYFFTGVINNSFGYIPNSFNYYTEEEAQEYLPMHYIHNNLFSNLEFEVQNDNIVTIDKNGLIIAISNGTTPVKMTIKNAGVGEYTTYTFNVTVNSVVQNNIDYTVEYYIDNIKNDYLTEFLNAPEGTIINSYPEKLDINIVFDKIINLPLTLTKDGENIIKVHYKTEPEVLPEPTLLKYIVEYYYDGVLDTSKTDIFIVEDGTVITSYEDKLIEGYILKSVENLPLTITEDNENIVKVYYVKTNPEPTLIDYKIEYYYDDVIDTSKTDTFKVEAGTVITTYEDKLIEGYILKSIENLPFTITKDNENIIKVYYVKTNPEPTLIDYKIEYYYDDVIDTSKTDTFKVEAGTVITTYEDKLIEGYILKSTANLPLTIAEDNKNIISVYYIEEVKIPVENPIEPPIDYPEPEVIVIPEPEPEPEPEVIPEHKPEVVIGQVYGIVTGIDGRPLPGILLELHSEVKTTYTDSKGRYSFDNVELGVHQLIAKNPNTLEIISSTKITVYEKNDSAALSYTADMAMVNNINLNKEEQKRRIDFELLYTAKYKVEYYYNGVLDNNMTDIIDSTVGFIIKDVQDKNRDGFRLLKISNVPLTITADDDNLIKVYYVREDIVQTGYTNNTNYYIFLLSIGLIGIIINKRNKII